MFEAFEADGPMLAEKDQPTLPHLTQKRENSAITRLMQRFLSARSQHRTKRPAKGGLSQNGTKLLDQLTAL